MKLSLSHERLKSEGIGLPFCPYNYIKFKTSFHVAVTWNNATSNLHRFAKIWCI